MAAAEARAAWQRTANRCFVQEDAKRAPKLARCPSTSTLQHDSNNTNTTNGQEHPTPSFVPLNWNPMNSNLPPDTRWWLQLQPSFGYQKDFTCEQVKNLEGEEEKKVESADPSMKRDSEKRIDETKTATNNTSQQPLKRKIDMGDYLFEDDGNKCGPWWRISDQDELASLVAQKSLEHIENCDLPRPAQTVHVCRDPFTCLESLDRIFSPSVSYKLHSGISDPVGYLQHSSTSVSIEEKYWSSSDGSRLISDPEKLYSKPPSGSNSSRAELLEALRHSQTRAREAEIAAQKAYNEKEHIIKLFFRQASHLFAYKQWLQMLQLESLCIQLKIKDHQIATMFPVLPWIPLKEEETSNKPKKRKKCSLCKYALAFAVGLGLAGAGLILGWTWGWLIPHL